jgi:predicted Rossmann-fold nucleotide-binding protein
MAKYADAVALLPGGRGTDNMRENARRYGLKIYEYDDIKRT